MNLKKLVVVVPVVVSSLVAIGGCKKSEDKAEGGTAAAGPACSDKALKHTNPNFCVDLPAGYEPAATELKTGSQTRLNVTRKSDKEMFGFSWGQPGSTYDSVLAAQKKPENPADKVLEQGDTPTGVHFIKIADAGNPKLVTVNSVVKSGSGYVTCGGYSDKPDFVDEMMKICKDVRVQ